MLPTFEPYPRISNRPALAPQDGVDDPAQPWVVTHKVDGTNMSVIVTTDGGVHYARRNGLLGKDKTFYGFHEVLPTYAPWAEVLGLVPVPPTAQVTLYGEFFGKGVQKSIAYGPDKRFVGFDVAVDGKFLDVHAANAVFDRLGVPRLEIVFSGTRRQALQWAHEHKEDDVCPAWYGDRTRSVVPGNTGEGWIVRPVEDATMDNDDRFIFKVKSDKWLEGPEAPGAPAAPAPATATATAAGVDDTATDDASRFARYVTAGRVASVLSKLDPSEKQLKHTPALIAKVLEDAAVDAGIDGVDVAKIPAAVKKAHGKMASVLIHKHLREGTAT